MAITYTAKGTDASKTLGTTLTISGVSIDGTVIVGIAWEDDNTGEVPTVKIGNRVLNFISGSEETRGDTIIRQYKSRVKNTKAKDITASWPTALTARAMIATQITDASRKDVAQINNQGSGTGKNTGATQDSTVADVISMAFFAMLGPTTDAAPTAGASHTLGQIAGTSGNGAGSNITLVETYRIRSTIGNVRSTLTLVTARASAQCHVAYKAVETYSIDSTFHKPIKAYLGANKVIFQLSDSGSARIDDIEIPTDLFDVLTDQQITDYLKAMCKQAADVSVAENELEQPDSDIETRLATFETDTIAI